MRVEEIVTLYKVNISRNKEKFLIESFFIGWSSIYGFN
jgi:hypothetical protein